ncbi:MAG: thioredoxin family protein [Nitrososphaerota archaeon]
MPHPIELFVGGCPLCKKVRDMLEVGKCSGCRLDIYDLAAQYDSLRQKIHDYHIRCVPTIVIDGKIRVEGLPQFTFVCSDELYRQLEMNHSFR